jgi:hypothetical protein
MSEDVFTDMLEDDFDDFDNEVIENINQIKMEKKELLKALANEIYNLMEAIAENDQPEIYEVRANIREILKDPTMALIIP